jgi:hypothetical protein
MSVMIGNLQESKNLKFERIDHFLPSESMFGGIMISKKRKA